MKAGVWTGSIKLSSEAVFPSLEFASLVEERDGSMGYKRF